MNLFHQWPLHDDVQLKLDAIEEFLHSTLLLLEWWIGGILRQKSTNDLLFRVYFHPVVSTIDDDEDSMKKNLLNSLISAKLKVPSIDFHEFVDQNYLRFHSFLLKFEKRNKYFLFIRSFDRFLLQFWRTLRKFAPTFLNEKSVKKNFSRKKRKENFINESVSHAQNRVRNKTDKSNWPDSSNLKNEKRRKWEKSFGRFLSQRDLNLLNFFMEIFWRQVRHF